MSPELHSLVNMQRSLLQSLSQSLFARLQNISSQGARSVIERFYRRQNIKQGVMKHMGWVHIKYLIDFAALFFFYAFAFFKKWKSRGRDVLIVNTLMYIYLSFVLFFTLMPIIVSIPFILNHPYTPMNLIPFVDILMGRGDFIRQIALNVIMTIPFGFLLPLTDNRTAKFGKTIFFVF